MIKKYFESIIKNILEQLGIKSQSDMNDLFNLRINQLNEVNKIDFDDREEQLRQLIEDQSEEINARIVDLEQTFTDKLQNVLSIIKEIRNNNEILTDSISEMVKQIEIIDSQYKQAINKSRSDTAIVIKSTRDKLSDIDIKLDAFIDTISERLVDIKTATVKSNNIKTTRTR